jgi:hypothetical protein
MKKMINDSHRSGPVRNWYMFIPLNSVKTSAIYRENLTACHCCGLVEAIITFPATSGKIKTVFAVLNPDPFQ